MREPRDPAPATETSYTGANSSYLPLWSPLLLREDSVDSSDEMSVSLPWLTFQAILIDILVGFCSLPDNFNHIFDNEDS
jgi:hypothetical protein